jgi:hypothetical protein
VSGDVPIARSNSSFRSAGTVRPDSSSFFGVADLDAIVMLARVSSLCAPSHDHLPAHAQYSIARVAPSAMNVSLLRSEAPCSDQTLVTGDNVTFGNKVCILDNHLPIVGLALKA